MTDIKTQTFSGFIWAAVGSIGNGFITLLVTFVLARLLCPADFGVLEIILVVNGISSVLIDSGFSQSLIRDKKSNNLDKSTVFYVNLLLSTSIYVILFAFAPLFERYFEINNFALYCRVAFITIIIDALSVIQNTVFTADMNFKPITLSTIVSVIISGVIAVLLAYLEYGIWSLIVMMLLTSILKTSLLWFFSTWRPVVEFSKKSFIKYWKFGSFVFLQSLIDKIMINIESLIIGCFYTKDQLGYFSQSRKIDSYFGQALTSIVVKVTYPALIKIDSSNEVLKSGYRKILGLTTFFISPFMIFLIAFPYLTMGALYGNNWIVAGQYLRLWAVFGLVHPIQSICINIFYVKGESKLLFYISTVKQIVKIVTLCLLATSGIKIMLEGIIITSVIMMVVFVYYSGRLIDYNLKETTIDVSKNIILAIVATFISYTFNCYIISDGMWYFLNLIIVFSLSISLYMFLSFMFGNKNFFELLNLIKSKTHWRN